MTLRKSMRLSPTTMRGLRVSGWVVIGGVVGWHISLLVRWRASYNQQPPWPLYGFVDYRDTITVPIRVLFSGGNPYLVDAASLAAEGHQPFNLYLPHHFVLFGWMAAIPPPADLVLMTALCVGAAAWLVMEGFRIGRLPISSVWLPWVVALVVARPPVAMSIRQGQIALFLSCAVWFVLSRRAPLPCGVALCVALVKPQVGLPLLAYLLLARRWRAAGIGLGLGSLLSLPIIITIISRVGVEAAWHSVIGNAQHSMADKGFLVSPLDMPGLARLLAPNAGPWLVPVATVVTAAVCAYGILRTLPAAGGPGEGSSADLPARGDVVAHLWVASLATIVITPSLRYSTAALIPPVVACAIVLLRDGRLWPVVTGMTVGTSYVLLRSHQLESVLGIDWDVGLAMSGLLLGLVLCLAVWRRGHAELRTLFSDKPSIGRGS